LPYEYEKLKNNFCQNIKDCICSLLKQYKFNEAETLYLLHSKILIDFRYKDIEKEYLEEEQKEKTLNRIKLFLDSSNFIEADNLSKKISFCFETTSTKMSKQNT